MTALVCVSPTTLTCRVPRTNNTVLQPTITLGQGHDFQTEQNTFLCVPVHGSTMADRDVH